MIDLPIGKAIIAVEATERKCKNCCFEYLNNYTCAEANACYKEDRKDGKNVIFKIVDYPSEFCKHPMKMCKENWKRE